MAVSSPRRNWPQNRNTSGLPLDGLSGLAPVFQTFYIQVWKNISVVFFHTPRIYTL